MTVRKEGSLLGTHPDRFRHGKIPYHARAVPHVLRHVRARAVLRLRRARRRAARWWTGCSAWCWSTRPCRTNSATSWRRPRRTTRSRASSCSPGPRSRTAWPERVEDDGVLVVPKPLSRVVLTQALRLTRAARRAADRPAERKPPPAAAHRGHPRGRPREVPADRVLRHVRARGARLHRAAGHEAAAHQARDRRGDHSGGDAGLKPCVFVRYRPRNRARCRGKIFPLFCNSSRAISAGDMVY